MSELRKSGIDVLGDIPWGSHFCQFYETKKDLLDLLIPYFKAGLENNEFCLWVTCNPLTKENAFEELQKTVPNFDHLVARQSIEILTHVDWYLKGGQFNPKKIIKGWGEKLQTALAKGYDGMRVNGNETWLEQEDWEDFMQYERELNSTLHGQRMIVLCTYPLSKTTSASILDVAHSHERAISKRKGRWEILEDLEIKEIKEQLKKKNYELEQKVIERTQKLTKTVRELENEISAREKIEAELKRSELRYRTLIEQASDAIITTDENGRLIEVNTSFCKMFGYDEKELIGMNITTLIDPEHLKKDPLRFDLLLEGNALIRERLMKKRDGTVFPIEEHVKMLSDKRILAIVREITGRKLAEDELRLAYQRLSYHVENTPLAVIELDKDLFIKRWSKRAEEIFGWKEFEALGKNVYDPDFPIIYIEDIPAVDKINEQLSKGVVNRNLSLNRNYTKDGNIIYCEWYNSVLRDEPGNVITILSLVHNVTEKRVAEEQIRRSEAHLAEAQQLAKMGSWDFDIKADRLIWSEELYNVFGTDKQTFRETHDSFLHLIDEEDRDFALQTSRHTQQTGEPFTIEYHITTPKGDKRIIQEHGYGQKNENGKVVRLFGAAQDITERKKTEDTLKQSYEEIRRLTEHLQKIREEERTHIAREIHDELGQQLTAIKMDVAWIDKKTPEETTDIKRKLKNIIGLLDGSNQSVRRILSELRPLILDDHGLLEAIEWLGRQFTENTGIPVKFTTPEKNIKVSEQMATSVFRVCQEAFTNITRYSQAKNISISIKIIEENIKLIIEDDGIGFDPGSVQNKTSFGILGMKERVLSLDGRFELVSSPGKGTKIIVSLPYKAYLATDQQNTN